MTDAIFDPHDLHPDDFLEEVHSFEFWFQSVDGYLSDRPHGRLAASNDVPIEGAGREALITTLCNYCVGETAALEGAGGMISIAPNRHSKIFLATQVVDEARHLGFGENDLGRLLQDDPDARVRVAAIRQELDALVLAAFDGALADTGSIQGDQPTLGRDYLATIDRLGLV